MDGRSGCLDGSFSKNVCFCVYITPQKSKIDTNNCHAFKGTYLFQPHLFFLGIQLLVFGGRI